jgi:two-component system, LytTR family, response regulator
MTEIRTLIVDDEPPARRGIRQLLAPHPEFVVVGECRDGREALRSLDQLAPDLLFLDIQMPGLDGLGVLRARGADRMPATVFVTAHDEFAVRAFEAHAIDYLVKPLSEARFRTTLERVRQQIRMQDAVTLAARLGALLAGADTPAAMRAVPTSERLAVPTPAGLVLIDLDEIDWITAEDDQARLHVGPKHYRVRESLATLEARLDPVRYARIHRSAIVRLGHVRTLAGGGDAPVVVLQDGTRLPVSRRRLARITSLLRHP